MSHAIDGLGGARRGQAGRRRAEKGRALSLAKLVIDRVFPFEEAPRAFEHVASGAHFGKVVIAV